MLSPRQQTPLEGTRQKNPLRGGFWQLVLLPWQPRCHDAHRSKHSLLHGGTCMGLAREGQRNPVVFSEALSQASRLDNKAIKHLPATPALRKQSQNIKLTQTKDLGLIQS